MGQRAKRESIERSMKIRPEHPEEFVAIRDLVEVAFRTAPHADGNEHEYVDRLRAGPGYLPELALILVEDGVLLGHIMLTRLFIVEASVHHPVLLLSPVCVRLERRNAGLGSRLIREALARARAAGHSAVVLVGDPDFYWRFGFRCSTDFGIANVSGFAEKNVMVCELVQGSLCGVRGTVSFPS